MSTTMTLLGKLEIDVKIKAPASKVYEIFQAKPYLIPKISPENVQSVELLKGEWGKPGSILLWNSTLDGQPSVAKALVETVDEENNLITSKALEGNLLEVFKSFKNTIQSIQKDKGSVVRLIFEFETLQCEIPELSGVAQYFVDITKDIDAYLTQDNQGPYEDVAATSKA